MMAHTAKGQKASILLIYTGGTIGMKEDPVLQALLNEAFTGSFQ